MIIEHDADLEDILLGASNDEEIRIYVSFSTTSTELGSTVKQEQELELELELDDTSSSNVKIEDEEHDEEKYHRGTSLEPRGKMAVAMRARSSHATDHNAREVVVLDDDLEIADAVLEHSETSSESGKRQANEELDRTRSPKRAKIEE